MSENEGKLEDGKGGVRLSEGLGEEWSVSRMTVQEIIALDDVPQYRVDGGISELDGTVLDLKYELLQLWRVVDMLTCMGGIREIEVRAALTALKGKCPKREA